MSEKIKISAVSYTNTKPFVYGLQHSPIFSSIQLSLDIPSVCADKLINNQADIGLVPVAALLKLPEFEIISDYCIGANGAVHSVFIFSDKPIREIKTIRADRQSRTSNLLAKVLLKNYWKISPQWVEEGPADSFVEIGDRTFGKANHYAFAYDLSENWQKLTQLPFVFAAWVSTKTLTESFISDFNQALKFGLENRDAVIKQLATYPNFDLAEYLHHYIDYNLDSAKKEALKLFLSLAKAIN